ncbi:unnamed protein product [Prorocentrum cordatum]|uniref:Uncharacterized protein n=1 Tax=Prorocentrum cordatum TaxID=2364126 RepID=A0ABN9PQA3_9DINO|nr:unnamed protein product [Polarella glacialis]
MRQTTSRTFSPRAGCAGRVKLAAKAAVSAAILGRGTVEFLALPRPRPWFLPAKPLESTCKVAWARPRTLRQWASPSSRAGCAGPDVEPPEEFGPRPILATRFQLLVCRAPPEGSGEVFDCLCRR